MKKYRKVCRECGSDDISYDASANWDINTQSFIVDDIWGYCFCRSCEGESKIKDVEIIELNTNTKVL